MATDLRALVPDRPGSLAAMCEALGKAGVNVDGLFGYPSEVGAINHVLVEDPGAARSALTAAGFEVSGERAMFIAGTQY